MKEIKVFLHNTRVAAVIEALVDAGHLDPANPRRCLNLNVALTKSLSPPLDSRETSFSVELGQAVINESKLELLCPNDRVEAVVDLIRERAHTGQAEGGWICITRIDEVIVIGDGARRE